MIQNGGSRRSLLDVCFGFFIACVLVYVGIQLLRSVLGWLIAGAALVAITTLIGLTFRWRRERW